MGKTLILGGNGYIGQYLIEKLSVNNKLVVADRNIQSEYYKNNIYYMPIEFDRCENFDYYLEDIDTVIHLISTIIPKEGYDSVEKEIEENVFPTIKLLKAMRRKKTKKIIFLSSGGTIYGNHNKKPIAESEQTNPICNYGITKLLIEKYLDLFSMNSFDYRIVRLANPYSSKVKNGKKQGIIPIIVDQIMNNETIHIWGNGEDIRDYIYMDDAIDAIAKIIEYEGKEKIFNVGTGRGTSIKELIDIISRKLKCNNISIIYEKERVCDVDNNVLDISKIKNELNWKPNVNLENGIDKIIEMKRKKSEMCVNGINEQTKITK